MKALKSKKRTAILLVSLSVISALVVIAIDYHNFSRSGRSYVFRHRQNYTQNEAVSIGDIDVTLFTTKLLPAAAKPACTTLDLIGPNYNGYVSPFTSPNAGQICPEANHGGLPGARFTFKVNNVSQSLVNSDDYHFDIAANTNIQDKTIELQSRQILPNSEISAIYSGYVASNYVGGYQFKISYRSVTKTITVTSIK